MAVQSNARKRDIFDTIIDSEINQNLGEDKSQKGDIFDTIINERTQEDVAPQEDGSFLGQAGDVITGAFGDTLRDVKEIARPIARTGRILASGTLGTAAELANLAVNPFAEAFGAEGLAEATQPGVATEAIKGGFDVLTGGLGQPQTEQEKVLDTAGEFASSLLLGGGIGAAGAASKGVNLAVKFLGAESMAEIIGAAVAGAASEKLRQNDVEGLANVLGTLGAGVVGGGVARTGGKVAKLAAKKLGSGLDIASEAFGFNKLMTENALSIPESEAINIMSTPKEIRLSNIKDLAKRTGVDLPLSLFTENGFIRGVESLLSASPLSGNFYHNMMKKTGNKLLKNYEDALNDVSRKEYNNAFNAGGDALDKLKENRELATIEYTKFYDKAESLIPPNENVDWSNTKDFINDLVSKLNKRISPSEGTKKVLGALKPLQESLSSTVTDTSLVKLTETKNSLNSLVKSGEAGTSSPFFKKIIVSMNKDIKSHVKLNKDSSLTGNENISWGNTKESVDGILSSVNKKLVKSEGDKKLIEELTPLRKAMSPNKKRQSLENLIETKQSLNEMIKFGEVGGTAGSLKRVVSSMDQDIQNYAKKNKEFGLYFNRANELFGTSANRFRNGVVRTIIKNERPENVLKHMNSITGTRQIGDALSTTPNGEKLFGALRRLKLQDMLTEKFMTSTRDFRNKTAATALSELKNQNSLIQELAGKESYKKLRDIGDLAGEMSASFSKFANPSGTAQHLLLGSGISAFIHGLATGNLAAMASPILPFTASAVLTNPRFIGVASRALNAVKRNDIKSMNKSRLALLSLVREEEDKNKSNQ